MSEIVFDIVILLLLILLNGVFALSEIALISARRIRLEQLVKRGSKGAQAAIELSDQPELFLSTVQVGISLVAIFAGAFGGATLAQHIVWLFEPLVGPSLATSLSLTLVVGAITYLSVVIGELVPKQLALANAEAIAVSVARPMKTLAWLATPIVKLLSFSTRSVIRVFGLKETADTTITEEEIRGMVRQGAQAGIIEEAEREMVEGVFRLGDYRLQAVLTPRPEIIWLDINDSPAEIQETIRQADNSRFPVCDGELDNVLGIVRSKTLLDLLGRGDPFDLKGAMTTPIFMPETMSAIKALEMFKRTGTHLALIVDEYGGVEGLVTLFDILEAIVGDIPTPEEIEDPRITRRKDGTWLVDGIIAIQDFKEHFLINELPEENAYQTLGGFILNRIGELPQPGQQFDWEDYRFEVVDMDGNRVDKILVSKE